MFLYVLYAKPLKYRNHQKCSYSKIILRSRWDSSLLSWDHARAFVTTYVYMDVIPYLESTLWVSSSWPVSAVRGSWQSRPTKSCIVSSWTLASSGREVSWVQANEVAYWSKNSNCCALYLYWNCSCSNYLVVFVTRNEYMRCAGLMSIAYYVCLNVGLLRVINLLRLMM